MVFRPNPARPQIRSERRREYLRVFRTAERSGIAAFPYLVALLSHSKDVRESPADWMPWSYEATVARRRASAPIGPSSRRRRSFDVDSHGRRRIRCG